MRSLDHKEGRNGVCDIVRAVSQADKHGTDHHQEPICLSHEVDSLNLTLWSLLNLTDKT
jgi:hypothetical protein